VNGIGSPRAPRPHDVFGDEEEHQELGRSDTAWGTVGWDGDKTHADVVDLGDGSDGPLGRALVHVTLFEGRDFTKRPEKGKAQGQRVRAQLGWPLTVVPPLGMSVVVVFPGGDRLTPGNAVILCGVDTSPTEQFRHDMALLDVGPDIAINIKGKRTTLLDHTKPFPAWLCVGLAPGNTAPGIYASDGAGDGLTIGANAAGLYCGNGGGGVKAVLQLGGPSAAEPGIGLLYNGAGFLSCDTSGNWDINGPSCSLGVGTITLGAGAGPVQPVLWGFSGIMGVPSTSVFVSI
jgi:hypothetical protein